MVTRALGDQALPVYGDGMNVRDHGAAIWAVATRGRLEDGVYNIGGEAERPNLETICTILSLQSEAYRSTNAMYLGDPAAAPAG